MSHVFSETMLSITEVSDQFPGREPGTRLNPNTVRRWIRHGARASDGSTVKLEAVRLGSRLITSREALGRFLAKL